MQVNDGGVRSETQVKARLPTMSEGFEVILAVLRSVTSNQERGIRALRGNNSIAYLSCSTGASYPVSEAAFSRSYVDTIATLRKMIDKAVVFDTSVHGKSKCVVKAYVRDSTRVPRHHSP